MNADFEASLRAQIDELEERRAKLHAELARVEGHLGGLRQALSLYHGQSHVGHETSRSRLMRGSRMPDPRKSEAWAFALEKMEHASPEGVGIDELDTAIADAGFELSRNTLRANLSNAAKQGVIERVAYGRYRKRKSDDARTPAEPDYDSEESSDNSSGEHTPSGPI